MRQTIKQFDVLRIVITLLKDKGIVTDDEIRESVLSNVPIWATEFERKLEKELDIKF